MIAAYNIEKYIAEALESVIKQTIRNIEIIIVNDDSTDSTEKIIKSFAERDKRIILISQENQGLGYARNSGIALAKGEYVHLMDGDDYMEYDFLEYLVVNADKNKSDLVISTHRAFEDGADKTLFVSSLPHTLVGDGYFSSPICLWRRVIFGIKYIKENSLKKFRLPKKAGKIYFPGGGQYWRRGA